MTTEMWIIAAFRIASALPVLRWPLAGAFIAIFADLFDLFLRDWLDLGGVKGYQTFDKWLDQAYMLTFLIVALRWQPVPRNIAVALYVFRLVGFITFELTSDRWVLIVFPNAFEYWFIFVAALKTFGWEQLWKEPGVRSRDPEVTSRETETTGTSQSAQAPRHSAPGTQHSMRTWPLIGPFLRFAIPFRYSVIQLTVAAIIILAAKLFHEYTLHVGQWFEGFTATEALEAIWRFLTPPY